MSVKPRKGVQPKYLPPTNGSAWQHSLGNYLQIEYWKRLLNTYRDSMKGGCHMKNDTMEPVIPLPGPMV